MSQLDIAQKEYLRRNYELFAPQLVDELKNSLVKKKLVKTHELEKSVAFEIAEVNGWPVLRIGFMKRGRFIEIRAHRKTNTPYRKMVEKNQAIWGINKGKPKKNNMWYTRLSWGMTYHVLVPAVMFDLHDLIRETFKQIEQ